MTIIYIYIYVGNHERVCIFLLLVPILVYYMQLLKWNGSCDRVFFIVTSRDELNLL